MAAGGFYLRIGLAALAGMKTEMVDQILETLRGECSRPSSLEFEMAYQVRIAIDRIRFAIRHTEHLAQPCPHLCEANLELLDALERLQSVDRRFQKRSRIPTDRNGAAVPQV